MWPVRDPQEKLCPQIPVSWYNVKTMETSLTIKGNTITSLHTRDTLWIHRQYTMANFPATSQLICIRFVFFVSLLEFIYNIIAFVCSNISAIHIQQFCNLMQNICNWKSISQFQIQKKMQSSTTPIHDFKQQLSFLAGHGIRTHDPWVVSSVPYPFPYKISYWKAWKCTYINTYQTFAIWYRIFAAWYKIFAIENLFLNSDTKYLQLKIYFNKY